LLDLQNKYITYFLVGKKDLRLAEAKGKRKKKEGKRQKAFGCQLSAIS